MRDDDLIKDGEIREVNGYWYAIYEFQTPLSEDQIKIAKRALLYKFMAFLESTQESNFYHKIIVHKDFKQIPNCLGQNFMHPPSVGLIIEYRREF